MPFSKRRIGRTLAAFGAALSGLISTGLGEVEMPQLVKRCRVPVPVAAGTSIAIIASTVLAASVAHIFQIMRESGVDAVPWNLVVYTVPGALIGGQIGGRLQGRLDEKKFERFMGALSGGIGVLFVANVLTGRGVTRPVHTFFPGSPTSMRRPLPPPLPGHAGAWLAR